MIILTLTDEKHIVISINDNGYYRWSFWEIDAEETCNVIIDYIINETWIAIIAYNYEGVLIGIWLLVNFHTAVIMKILVSARLFII